MSEEWDRNWSVYVLGTAVFVAAAFSMGMSIGSGELEADTETQADVNNETVQFDETEVTHFCIEQGYDDGYYSNYFQHNNCYQHHSTQKFQDWKNKEAEQ